MFLSTAVNAESRFPIQDQPEDTKNISASLKTSHEHKSNFLYLFSMRFLNLKEWFDILENTRICFLARS